MRANVEDRGMKGDCTPLMEAASAGHAEVCKLLIQHGADVNAQSSSAQCSEFSCLFVSCQAVATFSRVTGCKRLA